MSKKVYKDLTISEKIEQKMQKILKQLRDTAPEKVQFAEDIVYQLAFTIVTIERLVDEINSGGILENFSQGAQKFTRESPALKSYNTTIKSFIALSKQFIDLIPEASKKPAGEAVMNFITRPPGVIQR